MVCLEMELVAPKVPRYCLKGARRHAEILKSRVEEPITCELPCQWEVAHVGVRSAEELSRRVFPLAI